MNTSITTQPATSLLSAPKLAIGDWVAFVLMIAGAINWGLAST